MALIFLRFGAKTGLKFSFLPLFYEHFKGFSYGQSHITWENFENVGWRTSEKVFGENKKKDETCASVLANARTVDHNEGCKLPAIKTDTEKPRPYIWATRNKATS